MFRPMAMAWLTSVCFLLTSFIPPQDSSGAWMCSGCIGTGATASASGGSCSGAQVSVSVTMVSGSCAWVYDSPTSLPDCEQRRGCEVTVERSWNNLPAESTVDLCIRLSPGEPLLCLGKHGVSAGPTGSSSDARPSPTMECSDDASNTRSYSITSGECGLTATAQVTCSGCNATENEEGD